MKQPEFVYMTVIAATPETIWQHLTTQEFTQQYWHGTRIQSDFTKGSAVEFLSADGDASVVGEILESERPHRLAYSWQFRGNPATRDDPPSRVTFTLETLDVGTRLTVVHDQLAHGSKTAELVSFGWPHVISGLKTLLETGEAVDFTAAKASDCPGSKVATA